jgi:hypothetical protein
MVLLVLLLIALSLSEVLTQSVPENVTDPYAVDNSIFPICANVTYKYSKIGLHEFSVVDAACNYFSGLYVLFSLLQTILPLETLCIHVLKIFLIICSRPVT